MAVTEAESGAVPGAEQPEIEQLRQQVRNEHEMYLRALADFDNYRKRVERERDNMAIRERRAIILPLLELLDNFELALKHAGDAPGSLGEGVWRIYRQLQNMIERQGVTPVQSVGQMFDPRVHEAIGSIQDEAAKPGTVVEEVQRGYKWGDDLLRPARVQVAA